MQFPQLPTDNLYKFMAVFGLILVLTTYLSFNFYLINGWKEVIPYENNLRESRQKEKILQERKEEINKDIQLLNQRFEGNNDESVIERLKELQKEELNIKLTLVELANKYPQVSTPSARLLSFETQFIQENFYAGTILGGVLIFLGFYLWYTKLQRYQDVIVRNEANKISRAHELEITKDVIRICNEADSSFYSRPPKRFDNIMGTVDKVGGLDRKMGEEIKNFVNMWIALARYGKEHDMKQIKQVERRDKMVMEIRKKKEIIVAWANKIRTGK